MNSHFSIKNFGHCSYYLMFYYFVRNFFSIFLLLDKSFEKTGEHVSFFPKLIYYNFSLPISFWRSVRSFSITSIIFNHLGDYPTPKTLSYFWGFGSLAGVFLGVQILTGFLLTLHYAPNVLLAFNIVEHIMRDVNNGWLLRFAHCNGASFFFIVVYLHVGRAFYYNSFSLPRRYLWFSGVTIFLLLMATAFMGYVLPWGQMSFWGATVITNLFSAIPFIGDDIALWLWGGFSVDNPTLNRFFGLHFLLPFVILALVFLHLIFLHQVGSLDPIVGLVNAHDKLPFFPYFVVKDVFGLFIWFFFFFFFISFVPDVLGHPDNYIEANPMLTPAHIVPEWYFLPFYAMLRSVPDKLGGVFCMGIAIAALYFLSQLAYLHYVTTYNFFWTFLAGFFFMFFVLLGWLGSQSVESLYVFLGQLFTFFYFFLLFIFGFFFFFANRTFSSFSFSNFFILLVVPPKSTLGLLILFFVLLLVPVLLTFFVSLLVPRIFKIPKGFVKLLTNENFTEVFYVGFYSLLFYIWFFATSCDNLITFYIYMELAGFLPLLFITLTQRASTVCSAEVALKNSMVTLLCSTIFLFGTYLLFFMCGTFNFLEVSYLFTVRDFYLLPPGFIYRLPYLIGIFSLFCPIFLKLGFFPFHNLLYDIYTNVSFRFFVGYASFYNFGAIMAFFTLTCNFPIFLDGLAPFFLAIFFCTIVAGIVGLNGAQSSYRALVGYSSTVSTSLCLFIFFSHHNFFIDGYSFSAILDLITGSFIYASVNCGFLFYIFYLTTTNPWFFVTRSIHDFSGLRFQDRISFWYIFLLTGLPPTYLFYYKFDMFKITTHFWLFLFVVLVQILLTYFSARLWLTTTCDQKALALGVFPDVRPSYVSRQSIFFLSLYLLIFSFGVSNVASCMGYYLYGIFI